MIGIGIKKEQPSFKNQLTEKNFLKTILVKQTKILIICLKQKVAKLHPNLEWVVK